MSSYHTQSVERWNEMFEILVQYKQKYVEQAQEGGEMVVDKEDVSTSFRIWLDTQTDFWKHHKVGSDDILDERYQRLARLGGLGAIETVAKKGIISQEECWNDMYESLLGFKQKHGHVEVPHHYNENKKLGIWVNTWRGKYREYKRTNGKKGDPERMKCLKSIGLVDDISTGYEQRCTNSSWDKMVNQLLEFKQKHGHVKVPQQYNENKKLGRWVNTWRSKYREYKRMNGQKGDPVLMKHLESIGLVDDIITGDAKGGRNENWYDMYSQLFEFKQKYGHVKVPQRDSENKKLGNWVKEQRSNYRKYKRMNGQKGDPERMKCLESIGLVDDITTGDAKEGFKGIWYDMYNQLLEFKQKHGHVEVPQQYSENKKLRTWVGHWRSNYREYKRTNGQKGDPERMKHLESIGLVDDITTGDANEGTKQIWYGMYNQLLEFKRKHGHVKIPQRDSQNKKLGTWVRHWRSNYREYKKTNGQKGDPERMKCLESIGLVDDILFKIHHDKMTNCTNIKVSTPMIASSMSPTCSSYTQTISKEIPLLVGMKGEEKNDDNSGGVNHTQADSHFLGSELRGKGGFWV